MLAALLVFAAIAVVIGGAWYWWVDLHRFNAEDWRAERTLPCREKQDRAWMEDDLKENHLRIGMSPSEVTSLLGRPDERLVVRAPSNHPRWAYELEQMSSDCRHLYVDFERGGNVKDFGS